MMQPTSINISFTNVDASSYSDNAWLNLEQEFISDGSQVADFTDVEAMIALARSGMSARNYKKVDCPVTLLESNTAEVYFNFYVWPSSLTLPYSLSAGSGEITTKKRVDIAKEFDVVVPMSSDVQLAFLFDGEYEWLTNCFDEFGRIVAPPIVSFDGGLIELSDVVFGVLRLKGVAKGFEHTLTMFFDDVYVPEKISTTATTNIYSPDSSFISNAGRSYDGIFSYSPVVGMFPGSNVAYSERIRAQEETVIEEPVEDKLNSITNITNSVTCTWEDDNKTKELNLNLEIPECVLSALDSCPDSEEWSSVLIAEPPNDYNIIYYSDCTGRFLYRKYVRSQH